MKEGDYKRRVEESTHIIGNWWVYRDRLNWTLREDIPSAKQGRVLKDRGYYGTADQLARGLALKMGEDAAPAVSSLLAIQQSIDSLASAIRSTIKEPA
jgi:hypothetical protein